MHSGQAGGYKHRKPFLSCSDSDHNNIASWAVHIRNSASDIVSLNPVIFLMSQDMSAVAMRACRHCHTTVLENHRDDNAPDGKTRHVLRAIYYSWTDSLAQLSKNFVHLWRQADPPCITDGNLQIQRAIMSKLLDTKQWLIDQNTANEQRCVFIS